MVGILWAESYGVEHWQCPACPVRLAGPDLSTVARAAARHWQAGHSDELPADLGPWL